MHAINLKFETLIAGILENGYGVCDDFLTQTQVTNSLSTFKSRFDEGEFKQAGIGKIADLQTSVSIRGDKILWLEESSEIDSEKTILFEIQEFINYLNATCYLGIKGKEIHNAKYEEGTFYKIHRDRFETQQGRVLSIIFYLNQNWLPEHAGELIIYKENSDREVAIKINPIAGRMVCFESEKLEHEVLATNAVRRSITGWLLNKL